MCKLVLVGGGGHAMSLMSILPEPVQLAGYVDFADVPGMPLNRLGDDDSFLASPGDDVSVIITMVSGRSCSLAARASLVEKYSLLPSVVVVASSAIISDGVTLGKGTAVFHRAVINVGSALGEHCIVNTGAIVEHGCQIGKNVFIGPGAVVCGGVKIGNNVYVGANATIRPGVSICDDAIVGLGSAVIKDITVPGTYAGAPARKIK